MLGIDPLGLAESAAREQPDNFAIGAIAVLIGTADPVVGRGCDGFKAWDLLLRRFPEASRNMRPPAVLAMTEAIRAACPTKGVSPQGGNRSP